MLEIYKILECKIENIYPSVLTFDLGALIETIPTTYVLVEK